MADIAAQVVQHGESQHIANSFSDDDRRSPQALASSPARFGRYQTCSKSCLAFLLDVKAELVVELSLDLGPSEESPDARPS